ncbi:hypothetical protein COM84_25095 [Bacillus thuringiensis]|nr:hypothetical protein COM84_25095 [Bacillus thuringiensis]
MGGIRKGRLFLLEEITSKEMLFSTGIRNFYYQLEILQLITWSNIYKTKFHMVDSQLLEKIKISFFYPDFSNLKDT